MPLAFIITKSPGVFISSLYLEYSKLDKLISSMDIPERKWQVLCWILALVLAISGFRSLISMKRARAPSGRAERFFSSNNPRWRERVRENVPSYSVSSKSKESTKIFTFYFWTIANPSLKYVMDKLRCRKNKWWKSKFFILGFDRGSSTFKHLVLLIILLRNVVTER